MEHDNCSACSPVEAEPAGVSLRRAAFRAAKKVDLHVTKNDALLDAVEFAFGNGTDADLAAAVMDIVHMAEAVA